MSTSVDADFTTLARAFHGLADPKRLEIMALLTRGERCVCELSEVVGAKQPLLSFHLKALREAGLVKNRRRGKWMYYSLDYETVEGIKELIVSVADGTEHDERCCCESLCCTNRQPPTGEPRMRDETG